MNLIEFNAKYQGGQKHRIEITCDRCGQIRTPFREKAQATVRKNGEYLCPRCGLTKRHALHPSSLETKEKQRQGRLGKTQSEAAKKRMSEVKKTLYQTEYGLHLRRELSKKAAKEHANRNIETTRRRGLFPSRKNGDFVVFASSYELRAQVSLDENPDVVRYETQVYFELDDRHRSLDLLIFYRTGRILAVEVKAAARLNDAKVIDQIADSAVFAQTQGYDFEVWTEQDLGFKSPHEATKWADKFISQMTSVDYVEIRRRRNAEKALRHYRTKLSDQIEVYCHFCRESHTLREEQYLDNIEKNGRFICIRENGHITGKLPKDYLKKENPYAPIGKKLCLGRCGEIKMLDEFGDDKGRRDGKASHCKKCRAEKATAKYRAKKKSL